LGACQNPPVKDVVDAPLGAPQGVTLDQVRQAIIVAGAKRGWKFEQDGPNKLVASHERSGHTATIDITYTTTTFSIAYVDSQHLQYANGTVHPTYNRWIEFLQQDIQDTATMLAPPVRPIRARPRTATAEYLRNPPTSRPMQPVRCPASRRRSRTAEPRFRKRKPPHPPPAPRFRHIRRNRRGGGPRRFVSVLIFLRLSPGLFPCATFEPQFSPFRDVSDRHGRSGPTGPAPAATVATERAVPARS
jgi:hypothetical protein